MSDTAKIRSVVARFFDVPEAALNEGFVFPRERLQGSVGRTTLHSALKRMAGADLPGAFTANTFGELLNSPPAPNGKPALVASQPLPAQTALEPVRSVPLAALPDNEVRVGIDVEVCENLPATKDSWSDPFYQENFTAAELAYCSRQHDPRQSLCGLWSAKEAVMKCGADFAGLRPGEIEIGHDPQGRPLVRLSKEPLQDAAARCSLSISHAGGMAIAVCVQRPQILRKSVAETVASDAPPAGTAGLLRLIWFNLALTALSLLLWLVHLLSRK